MRLDPKLASAFTGGAILACGIVYFSVKPAVIVQVPAKSETPKRRVAAPTMLPPAAAPLAVRPERVPIREKPSPMPPPVRHETPAVARYQPPPVASRAPEPTPPPAPRPLENAAAQNVSLPAQPSIQDKTDTRVTPTVTLPAGAVLAVRLGQTLSSAQNQPGDSFFATLTQPLVVDGWVIAERGARAEGRVVEIAQSTQGAAHLEISIVRVALSDGQTLRLHTEPYAASVSNRVFSRKAAEIPTESRLTFRVLDPITVTERVN